MLKRLSSPGRISEGEVFFASEKILRRTTKGGSQNVKCARLPRGLYQFSVIADGADYPWERLYFLLDKYGNRQEQTGPWDFDLRNGNRPLVPSYWVELNGRRLGLWHFRRVTQGDLEKKTFQGRLAFLMEKDGPVELRFIPHGPVPPWISATLEKDPEDELAAALARGRAASLYHLPESGWKTLRANLKKPAWAQYRRAWSLAVAELERGFHREEISTSSGWNLWQDRNPARDVILHLAAWKMGEGEAFLEKARELLKGILASPHWGGGWEGVIAEDGYGCDGDLHAMEPMRAAAIALHFLPARDGLRREILSRVRRQGRRFLELALLQRDYWGGCLLQDHGWRSLLGFATSALLLRPLLAEADLWARFAVPRVMRALEAFPADGSISEPNYEALSLVAPELFHFRTAWKAVSGEDVLATHPKFQKLPAFALSWNADGGNETLTGTNAYLHHLRQEGNTEAAALLKMIFQRSDARLGRQADSLGTLEGLIVFNPRKEAHTRAAPAPKGAHYFPGTGRLAYRDGAMMFRVSAGPVTDGERLALLTNPNDKAQTNFGRGHFHCTRGAEVIFATPMSPYRLSAAMRSCLLVNGKGQQGDIGYPMSLPVETCAAPIRSLRQDGDDVRRASLTLDLGPLYPAENGVLKYSREFAFEPGRMTICDTITCARPAMLEWLFQWPEKLAFEQTGAGQFLFPGAPALRFRIGTPSGKFRTSLRKTKVVSGYMGAAPKHVHLRIVPDGRRRSARFLFELTWTRSQPSTFPQHPTKTCV